MNKNIDYKKDLAEKLEELKKIEGFPIGTDEDFPITAQWLQKETVEKSKNTYQKILPKEP